MCVYVCISSFLTHIYIYIYAHIYIYINIHTCLCLYIYIIVFKCTYVLEKAIERDMRTYMLIPRGIHSCPINGAVLSKISMKKPCPLVVS